MLDQFGGIDVGHHDGRLERSVNFLHGLDGALGLDADNDAIGLHEILDGETFAEKFGIADNVEFDLCLAVAGDGFGDFLAGLDGDGAFIDDDFVAAHACSDVAGDAFDEGEVDGAVRLRRCGDADKNDVGIFDAFLGGSGERESAGFDIAFDQFFEAGLVDGDSAGTEHVDFGFVAINTDDTVTDFCEASAGYQSHITRSDDADF